MQITILDIKLKENLTEQEILKYTYEKYKIRNKNIINGKLVKKSLDLRVKNDPYYIYQVVLELREEERKNPKLHNKHVKLDTTYSDEIEIKTVDIK